METSILFGLYIAQFLLGCEMYFTWRPIYFLDYISLSSCWDAKRFREKIKSQTSFSIYFFFFENRSVYEIMWKNSVDSGRLQMTIWRIAYWIRRATNTLSKHVILIAFPLLHWLNERALVLRYMYIASLFHSCNC